MRFRSVAGARFQRPDEGFVKWPFIEYGAFVQELLEQLSSPLEASRGGAVLDSSAAWPRQCANPSGSQGQQKDAATGGAAGRRSRDIPPSDVLKRVRGGDLTEVARGGPCAPRPRRRPRHERAAGGSRGTSRAGEGRPPAAPPGQRQIRITAGDPVAWRVRVDFAGAVFSGGEVGFAAAAFSGSEVDLSSPRSWEAPPVGVSQSAPGVRWPSPEGLAGITALSELSE